MVPSTDQSTGASRANLYVQMPAYRDLELVPTLRNLYAQAARPGQLRVRVMWQRAETEVLPDDVRALPGLEVDEVPAARSEGCNWARRRLQEAWDGERYVAMGFRQWLGSHGHRRCDFGTEGEARDYLMSSEALYVRRRQARADLARHRPCVGGGKRESDAGARVTDVYHR